MVKPHAGAPFYQRVRRDAEAAMRRTEKRERRKLRKEEKVSKLRVMRPDGTTGTADLSKGMIGLMVLTTTDRNGKGDNRPPGDVAASMMLTGFTEEQIERIVYRQFLLIEIEPEASDGEG